MNKMSFKNSIYLLTAYAVLVMVLIFLFYSTIRFEKTIEQEMLKISTTDVFSISENKAAHIQSLLSNYDHYSVAIQQSQLLQSNIEKLLEDLITHNIKYAYLLYRDKKGIFRFLVDGSKASEKSFMNQKFDIDSALWLDVYEKKKPMVIRHEILQQLSLTYVIPIVQKQKVAMVLVVDFAVKKIENINKIIDLMKNGLLFMIILIVIFCIIFIVQLIRYKKIKHSSFIDALTNVYNRNHLHEIEKNINLSQYVLATLDIDHFKKINDSYGHDIGDKVLKEVAKVMLNTVRKEHDMIIRYGGEEFVILIKHQKNDTLHPLQVIERIFNNIQEHKIVISSTKHILVTVSIGVNLNPEKSSSFMTAFKCADTALYEAKNTGRNQIKIYEI
jgi:diguanylate cyclase (GGDEF)-like protein